MNWYRLLLGFDRPDSAHTKVAFFMVRAAMVIAGALSLYCGYKSGDSDDRLLIRMGFVLIVAAIIIPFVIRKIMDALFD